MSGLVEVLFAAAPSTRWLRDPTRGGVGTCATSLHTTPARCRARRVCASDRSRRSGACDLLGIDPLYVANEGKLLAVVPAREADAARRGVPEPSARGPRHADRRHPHRAAGRRRAEHMVRGDPDRRHARRRSVASDLLAARWRVASAHRASAGESRRDSARRRFSPFRVPRRESSGLVGFVLNDSSGVLIEVEGAKAELAEVCALARGPPPLARVRRRSTGPRSPAAGSYEDFRIVESKAESVPNVAVSVDCAHVRRLPMRGRRPSRPQVRLSIHELHELRAALHDSALGPL